MLLLAWICLSVIGLTINNLQISLWRSGISPSSKQQDVSLRDGVTAESGGVASLEDVPLKELKDVEGTGLNALWLISQRNQSQLNF